MHVQYGKDVPIPTPLINNDLYLYLIHFYCIFCVGVLYCDDISFAVNTHTNKYFKEEIYSAIPCMFSLISL